LLKIFLDTEFTGLQQDTNLISVAFAVLFIGLSVDFGIHYGLRYKEGMDRDGDHARAKNLQADIDEKMERYQQQLSEAKALANAERNKLKKMASEEEAAMLAEAHKKASTRLQAIKQQVAVEAAEASKTLQKEAKSLAGQIATKILGRELAQ